MKAHKYWSLGAFACMIMAMISGYTMKEEDKSHHFWAAGSCICMLMSIYSGHKMISKKQKPVEVAEEQEADE